MSEHRAMNLNNTLPELSPRERVIRSLRGRAVDRPAWGELVLDDALIAGFLGVPSVGHAQRREFVQALGLDLVCVSLSQNPAGWTELADWAEDGDRYVFAVIDGGFSAGIEEKGFEPFLLDVARKNPGLHEYFRRADAKCLGLAIRALDQGADAVLLADDIAHNHGLLAPPDFFRGFYLPALDGFFSEMTRRGAPVFFHSDGDMNELLPALAHSGLSGLQCLEQAAGMDLAQVRRAVGPRFCLWGNLDPAWLTGGMGQAELTLRVEQNLLAAGQGPLIFGTSSGLYQGMKPRALRWLSRAVLA